MCKGNERMPAGLHPLTSASREFTWDPPLPRTPPKLNCKVFRTLVNSHTNETNYINHTTALGEDVFIYMEMNCYTRLAVRQLFCCVFLLMNSVSPLS